MHIFTHLNFKNMKISVIFSTPVIFIITTLSSSNALNISKGPQDTTTCMNAMAACDCGFTGANPDHVFPQWRIIFRSDNGSIINNFTVNGADILRNPINGLQWFPDLTSLGDNTAPNSKLLVGPVNKTHNQSSYQCMFTGASSGDVISSVGTMTVVGPPLVMINVDEICTTSITISLNTSSYSACGNVSHNVTISGNVIKPDAINGSKYTINNLHSDTLYIVRVTSMYNNAETGIRSVNTSSSRSPNPIDSDSIGIMIANSNEVTVMWMPPEIDECSMVIVKHYDVRISSSDGEIILESTESDHSTTFVFDYMNYMDDYSIITLKINITVVDNNGQRSESSVIERNITIPKSNENKVPQQSDESSNNSTSTITTAIIIVAITVIGLVILITVISYYLKRRYVQKNDHISINMETKVEDNSYVETQNGTENHDVASPYVISGPTSVWCDNSIHSNTHQDENVHEQSTSDDHVDESAHDDDFTPPLPPRMNYVELQLANEGPKRMKTDTCVTYAETKPA